MSKTSDILEITSKGNEAVVRFRSLEFPNELVIEQCQSDLNDYLKSHPCELLTFDLEGVVIIPSTMLGLFLTFRQRGIRIRLLNPSEHVVAVLEVTKLTSKIEVAPATGVSQE